ncbi:MAG: galactokinase [Clostridiales bacterium]|jgi:galactokinase|nr:galactokinase [Clostridiales bacterium]
MQEIILKEFKKVFGDNDGVRTYFAPGRVNLIGEHTDYNGGHVFPCALTIGTYAAVRKNKDNVLRFYSMNFEELGIINVSLDNLKYEPKDDWTNYPKGVIWALDEKGYKIDEGIDILFYGNIPNGSGLSSSASIEVLTGYIVNDLFGFGIDLVTIALLSQKAENEFVGVNSGIMDQFAIAMGKKDHAIFLDTSDLSYKYAPLKLDKMRVVIAASNKKRRLADSKYNERRSECEAALADLKEVVDINSLGDLSINEFEEYKDHIKNETNRKRAKHAVYENQRTIKAVEELKNNNIEEFGKLMNESHVSLRDDYEVTGIELDTLVEAAWKQEGVIGSRMTGAGFGGCTVSIVEEDKIDIFIEEVGKEYKDKIGYEADFYVVDIGDGPKEI